MTGQLCTFVLDGHLFAVPVEEVQEVLGERHATVVPLAPPEVRGLLNLRGQVVTAIDLRARLGLPERADGATGVNLVVRDPDGAVSLLVDSIGEVLEPEESAYEPVPEMVPAAVRELVTLVCKLDDRLLLVLDTQRATTVRTPMAAAPTSGGIA